jgi:lipid-A-disaccharide synthase-like uncharacterized protein
VKEYVIEGIGIIGAVGVLIAYGLNSYQKIRSDSPAFYWLNFTGGLLLIIYSIYKEAWANMIINVVWVLVAVIAITRIARKKRI